MFFKNNKSNDKQISSDKINHKLDNVKDISFEKRCRDEQYQSLRDFNAELFVNAFTYNLAQNTGNTGRSDSGIYGSIIVDIDICKSINLHMIKSQSDFESRIIELQHNKESQNARFMFDVYSLWQEYEFDPEFKTKVNEILWNEFHLYILKVADNIIEFVRECDYRDCDVQIRSKLYKIDSTKFECPERYIIKTVVTEKDDDPKNVLGFKFTVKQTEYSRDQYMKLCKTQL